MSPLRWPLHVMEWSANTIEGGQLPSFLPSTKSGGPLLAPAPNFKERGFAPLLEGRGTPVCLTLKFVKTLRGATCSTRSTSLRLSGATRASKHRRVVVACVILVDFVRNSYRQLSMTHAKVGEFPGNKILGKTKGKTREKRGLERQRSHQRRFQN